MQIKSISELKPGQELNIYNRQFNVTNRARFVRGDKTGNLNRDIGYFAFVKPSEAPEFAIWGWEIEAGYYVLSTEKIKISQSEKKFQEFKAAFVEVCVLYGGKFSPKDSIGTGVAYHVQTPVGVLLVSIHDDSRYAGKSSLASIFLRFQNGSAALTGKCSDRLMGRDFNGYSGKWNILCSAETLAAARQSALIELDWRLEDIRKATPQAQTVVERITRGECVFSIGQLDKPCQRELARKTNRGEIAKIKTWWPFYHYGTIRKTAYCLPQLVAKFAPDFSLLEPADLMD